MVTVTGTAFGVSVGGEGTSVAVREGSVNVRGTGPDARDLRSGQGVKIAGGVAAQVHAIDADQSFAWLSGRIVFTNMPFSAVVERLDRYHHGRVVLATRRIRDARVSGSYRLDDPQGVIRYLGRVVRAEALIATDMLVVLR